MKKVIKSFATALVLGVFMMLSSCGGSDDSSSASTDLFIKFNYNGVQ
jgi:ABC-type oligopeptide transport system substrate-binding subunit